MNLVNQLGPDEVRALTAVVICQLKLCQNYLDILGAGVPAAHVDRALGELIDSTGFRDYDAPIPIGFGKDFSEMDRIAELMG